MGEACPAVSRLHPILPGTQPIRLQGFGNSPLNQSSRKGTIVASQLRLGMLKFATRDEI
jgi:hypothetical protein